MYRYDVIMGLMVICCSLFPLAAVGVDVPPSRHDTLVPSHGAGGGQGHRLDVLVEHGRLGQPHQHDVVVQRPVVIALVPIDGVHRHVLLCPLVLPDVVLAQDGDLGIRAERGS